MDCKRFFCENIKKGKNLLSQQESHHLKNVMRLKPNDNIEIFDGKGNFAKAVVTDLTRKTVSIEAFELQNIPCRKKSRIVLAPSPPKGKRLDIILEKCTELGADHINLVNYQRTVKQAKANALSRYRKTMISAAKQSSTHFLPEITGPFTLAQSLDHLKKQYTNTRIFFGCQSGSYLNENNLDKNCDYIIFIGPEGGFTKDETELLKQNNASPICLADNILRIETAVIASAAVFANIRQKNQNLSC